MVVPETYSIVIFRAFRYAIKDMLVRMLFLYLFLLYGYIPDYCYIKYNKIITACTCLPKAVAELNQQTIL